MKKFVLAFVAAMMIIPSVAAYANEKIEVIVDGKEIQMLVKVGDKVITGKYSGTEVKVDGEEYTIVRQHDILAVIE